MGRRGRKHIDAVASGDREHVDAGPERGWRMAQADELQEERERERERRERTHTQACDRSRNGAVWVEEW